PEMPCSSRNASAFSGRMSASATTSQPLATYALTWYCEIAAPVAPSCPRGRPVPMIAARNRATALVPPDQPDRPDQEEDTTCLFWSASVAAAGRSYGDQSRCG